MLNVNVGMCVSEFVCVCVSVREDFGMSSSLLQISAALKVFSRALNCIKICM